MAEFLDPKYISILLTGVGMLALAAWLLILDFRSTPNRVFAGLLIARGATFFLGPLVGSADTPEDASFWLSFVPAAHILAVLLTIYFISVYPRRRGPLGHRHAGWAMIVVAAVAVGAAALWPDLYAGGDGRPGPLHLFSDLRLPALSLAGLVLAREYWKDPTGSAGFSRFLMTLGFTLNGLHDGTYAIETVAGLFAPDAVLPQGGYAWAGVLLPILSVPLSLGAVAYIGRVAWRSRVDPTLQEARRALWLMPLPPLTVILASLAPGDDPGPLLTFFLGAWRLSVPFLVTYALLRHSLFGFDLKIKAGAKRGIILGAFTLTFTLVSEAAEALIAGDRGPLFGVAAAGGLTLVSRPIQTLSEGAADRLMPQAKPIDAMDAGEREAFYAEQYRLVNQDGRVSGKERRLLNRLAGALGLDDATVDRLEGR